MNTAVSSNHPVRDRIYDEIVKGGSESPCPFCKLPRVRRSDYIRCCSCGVNWLDGEDITRHPSFDRMQKLMANTRAFEVPRKPPATVIRPPVKR